MFDTEKDSTFDTKNKKFWEQLMIPIFLKIEQFIW